MKEFYVIIETDANTGYSKLLEDGPFLNEERAKKKAKSLNHYQFTNTYTVAKAKLVKAEETFIFIPQNC